MYIADFEEFVAAATRLFAASGGRARYVAKYRAQDRVVVLKVTDDGEGLFLSVSSCADGRQPWCSSTRSRCSAT